MSRNRLHFGRAPGYHHAVPDTIRPAPIQMTLEQLVRAATERPLSAEEAEAAFSEVMDGNASPVQLAALLVAMRVRGAAPEEVAGGVRALRRAMVEVPASAGDEVVDTCGTGGGTLTTFNISTAAALVSAGAGVRVAKHGNRSFTSRCGSADVLESLGVRLDLTPEHEARILDEVGIVFMFAPIHHPAMRHVAPVRRELAMPTIMNVLGPLTNPARARRQVVGVADPALLDLIAGALQVLGHARALVVHGAPGLDELSPIGSTEIAELRDGKVTRYSVLPATFGWTDLDPADLAGGDPADNARVIREVFDGERRDAARAAVTLNAGAAVYVAGQADSLEEGVRMADEAVGEGKGLEGLERLRTATEKHRDGR